MLELTGEERTIPLSEDTEVVEISMGGRPEGEEPPEGQEPSFYGVGAAILAEEGTVSISESTISTDADGGAGIFAYGNSTVYVADTEIYTEKDTSGGIHAAGGGTLYAWDVSAATKGESSAAIRSDRGGGTMIVEGGDYTTEGTGSPAVYCTADIAVKDAELTAGNSEAVCMEGLNTLHLFDCELSGNMQDLDQNDCTWTIIVYQSMSGDSEVGNSTLGLYGGTVTSENGGLLYTTNTECTITMQDVDIIYSDDSEFFLRCTGNHNERGWGQEGNNGSDCSFTAISQEMEGDVIWDSISSLYSQGQILDENGNSVSIVGSDGTIYVEGDSSYTVTVDSYENTVDLTEAAESASWDDDQVEQPQML